MGVAFPTYATSSFANCERPGQLDPFSPAAALCVRRGAGTLLVHFMFEKSLLAFRAVGFNQDRCLALLERRLFGR
jgi:hypothetical protein